MKIRKKFNTLTLKEYFFYIDNYKKCSDFNTLGLYKSLLENEKLSVEERISVRDRAHQNFRKSFDFLQLKDPKTYIEIEHLGKALTTGDENRAWEEVRKNQEKILAAKKIRHRNFGNYSKHNCGYETCPLNGCMIKQGSRLSECNMWFNSDKSEGAVKSKAERSKAERKNKKQIIRRELEE